MGVVNIGWGELVGAAGFMVVAAVVSWRLHLDQTRKIVISTVRCFLQLLAMGLLLVYLIRYQTWWLVCIVLVGMSLAATQIAVDRVRGSGLNLWPEVFGSIFVSSMIIALLVVEAVIHADPWYEARILVPIAGMVMGNTLSAAAVAVDRLFSDLDARSDEILAYVALGATPLEAAYPSVRSAIAAGLTPALATMSAAGIVQIPGMMSGQILAGADPIIAAKYQIVVLLMISAATTLAIVSICLTCYRKRFTADGIFLSPALRDDKGRRRDHGHGHHTGIHVALHGNHHGDPHLDH